MEYSDRIPVPRHKISLLIYNSGLTYISVDESTNEQTFKLRFNPDFKPTGMKNLTICIALLVSLSTSYCQEDSVKYEDYFKKSKRQKTTAWVLLGAGVALITTGLLLQSYDNDLNNLTQDITGIGIGGAGIVCTLISVPVFLASTRNKRKAAALSLKIDKTTQLQNNTIVRIQYPAISIKISH